MTLQLEINTDGRVETAQLVTNEVGSEIGDCIVWRAERMRFDAPTGGSITVEQTFTFELE